MPGVCEPSEKREEEDEGKERGYGNDPGGGRAGGECKLKSVLFVKMRDKVLLYLHPHPLDNRMLLGWPVVLQSSSDTTIRPKIICVAAEV